MGLRMEMDIHLPSAAGSSGEISAGSDQKSALELIEQKDKVEAELKALGEVLDSVRFIRLDKDSAKIHLAWSQYEYQPTHI